jgi:hypothetical protein
MARQPFPTSVPYLQSLEGLHRLHALAVAGEDDSPEADEVRDGLEVHWRGLSDAERKRLTGLSEDLYSISSKPDLILPMSPEAQRRLVLALEARRKGEWDEALEVLRQTRPYLEPAVLSYLRGSIWQAAGDDATAALFLRHASESERRESASLPASVGSGSETLPQTSTGENQGYP